MQFKNTSRKKQPIKSPVGNPDATVLRYILINQKPGSGAPRRANELPIYTRSTLGH